MHADVGQTEPAAGDRSTDAGGDISHVEPSAKAAQAPRQTVVSKDRPGTKK